MKKTHLLIMATAALTGCSTKTGSFLLEANTQPLIDNEVQAQVDSLYEMMTPEERLAQLYGLYNFSSFFTDDGQLDTAKCRRELSNGVGHFSQFAFSSNLMPEQLRDRVAQMQQWLIANTPSHVPALFHEEAISGVNSMAETIYPQQIGLACTWNPALAELKTQQTARQMRSIGGLLALSPMVDVCRHPDFNRLEESYGEDGYLSAAMGVAFVKGLQSQGVAACSKHFLGYGGGGDAPEKELLEDILLPHEAMIRVAGSKVLMPGYHLFHGTKCIASPELLKGILREYVGFDGLIVSDYTAINQIRQGNTPVQNAAEAINASADVEFPNPDNFSHLPEAIEQGLVKAEDVEQAVKRVLALKVRLGIVDKERSKGYAVPGLYAEGPLTTDTPEERQTAYQLATQSVVLLKNNGVLPLASNPSKLALVGPNANSVWAMLGDYTYPCMSYFWRYVDYQKENADVVTLYRGLQEALPEGVSLSYERGCDWTEQAESRISSDGDQRAKGMGERRVDSGEEANAERALKLAAESDVIIAAMGENVLLDGENRDRGSVRLPGRQEDFVRQLIATGKPVVLVMFGGRAQVIGDLADSCAAIVEAWYPGEEGGHAVADILTGKVCPSGKLAVGYPDVELSQAVCYSYSREQDKRIRYPFGFGLSYTTFEYGNIDMPESVSADGEALQLSFTVKNTGSTAGDEVAQIYLWPAEGQTADLSPIKLQGFARVSLEPGQQKTLRFRMSPQQFGHVADRRWAIDPGKYVIGIGSSSQDIRLRQVITVKGQQTMPLRTVYFTEQIAD